MNKETPFVKDICKYIATLTDSPFYFGKASSLPGGKTIWLKAGELPRDTDGIFAIAEPTVEPDQYTPIQQQSVSFWARNKNTSQAFTDLMKIYNLLHQRHHYQTDNYFVYETFATTQPIDQDRDLEGGKLLQVSVIFYTRYLIS